MNAKPVHIIQKQVVDIQFPNIGLALEWQTEKQQALMDVLRRQLERCLDEYNVPNDHLILEKLDLDLGTFTWQNLHADLPGRMYAALGKRLREYQKTVVNGKPSVAPGWGTAGPAFEETPINDRVYANQHARLESLFFFLSKGYLPWWVSAEAAEWNEPWLHTLAGDDINRFRQFFTLNGDAPLHRFVTQFGDDFIQRLLFRLGIAVEADKAWQWLRNVFDYLQTNRSEFRNSGITESNDSSFSFSQPSFSLPLLRKRYWLQWMTHTLGWSVVPRLQDLFPDERERSLFIQSLHQHQMAVQREEMPVIWKEEWQQLINDFKNSKAAEKQKKVAKLTGETVPVTGQQPLTEILLQQNLSRPEEAVATAAEEETLYINDAGLVLLHPFLVQLFRHCRWLEEDHFVDAGAQTMAVYALYYLTSGNTEAPEYRLLLPKLLAGIPWETPLQPVEGLTDLEKAACDDLLTAVITHWKALRNTSPAGLREAYLQRAGKMVFKDNGWRLNVEQKTQDVLLTRLPWGFSIIKFPWMTGMLSVTWQ